MSTTTVNVLNKVVILILPLILSSCAVYSTGFTCPDSRGAKCVMLSQVDQMVDSGEIETVHIDKKCKSGKCKEQANVPQRALNKIHKVKLESTNATGDVIYQDGDYLYVR